MRRTTEFLAIDHHHAKVDGTDFKSAVASFDSEIAALVIALVLGAPLC